jgi:hypothetical protein
MSDKEEDVSPYLRRPCRSYVEVLRIRGQGARRNSAPTEQSGRAPNDPDLMGTADANNDA